MTVTKAKIGGIWTAISGYASNVFVGPNQPTDPNMQLWIDTDAVLTPVPWTNVTVLGTWANQAGMPAQCRKIGDIVYLRGSITIGATASALQLSAGYYNPSATIRVSLVSWNNTSYVASTGIITNTGEVQIYGASGGVNGFAILTGINWSVTP